MSRRRGSATALKASEVVEARGMDSIYSHIGICQEESWGSGEDFSGGEADVRDGGVAVRVGILWLTYCNKMAYAAVVRIRVGLSSFASRRMTGGGRDDGRAISCGRWPIRSSCCTGRDEC